MNLVNDFFNIGIYNYFLKFIFNIFFFIIFFFNLFINFEFFVILYHISYFEFIQFRKKNEFFITYVYYYIILYYICMYQYIHDESQTSQI